MRAPLGPSYSNQRSVNGDRSRLNGPGLTELVYTEVTERGLPRGPLSDFMDFDIESTEELVQINNNN